MKQLNTSLCCAWLLLMSPSALLANPTTKDPEALLKIRPTEKIAGDHVEADYAAISQRYQKARQTSDELWKKFEANSLAIGDARQVGPLYLQQAGLRRDADFLKSRAEACGWDLGVRVDEMDNRLRKLVREMLKLPGLNTTSLMNQIKQANAAGVKRLPQIEGLIKSQKYVQAEGELHEIIDDMMKSAIWFPDTDMSNFFRPFNAPLMEATELRKAKAVAELQAIVAQGPDFAKLQSELTQAAASIGSTGQATLNGQPCSGPELLQAWNTHWTKTQAAAQRAAIADWAAESLAAGGNTRYQQKCAAQQQFVQGLPALLAAIIQADAQRANAADAARIYPQYVSAAAALCAQGPRQELETALGPALTAVATKAGLEKDVASYRAATEPLLAWKRFLSRSRAKKLAGTNPTALDWATKVLGSPYQAHTIQPDSKYNIRQAKIASTTNQVLPGVFGGQPAPTVVVKDVVSASPAGGRWVSRYQERVFTLVGPPPAEAWKMAMEQLGQSLLVTTPAIPLTLEAAIASSSAQLGTFEAVGGPVEQVTLEPFLTRFITLPDEAGALLPRGPLPTEVLADGLLEPQPIRSLSVRCDMLQPAWFQHECFVLEP